MECAPKIHFSDAKKESEFPFSKKAPRSIAEIDHLYSPDPRHDGLLSLWSHAMVRHASIRFHQ
jgi:hypothetical protein